jgi:hypothetical protein
MGALREKFTPGIFSYKFWRQSMRKREQVSVPLDPELRAFVERAAEREDRSLAGQIRHLIAQAARAAQMQGEAA